MFPGQRLRTRRALGGAGWGQARTSCLRGRRGFRGQGCLRVYVCRDSITALSRVVNYAWSRRCAASRAGDPPVPPVVGAGVRVRGGPPDVGGGPGVLPGRRGQAAFASGGVDGCGRAGRVRGGGGWPVPVQGGGPARAGAAGGGLPARAPVTGV